MAKQLKQFGTEDLSVPKFEVASNAIYDKRFRWIGNYYKREDGTIHHLDYCSFFKAMDDRKKRSFQIGKYFEEEVIYFTYKDETHWVINSNKYKKYSKEIKNQHYSKIWDYVRDVRNV